MHTLVDHYRAMARNNAWSNHRLLTACGGLTADALAATRVSFFPSILLTLNHIVTVDWYYIDALEAGGRGLTVFDPEQPFTDFAPLSAAQRESDRRLVAFCDRLEPDDLGREVRIDRGDSGIDVETVSATLAHLFVHQIHHRGQVHAMLSGTHVAPPQLDEFFLEFDAHRRAPDLTALGW